ncbi:MAG: hypothetical protein EPO40_18740 [Myxococcaceae bacterium]|nr:MAG: hypothetical protein EPO40_18740 [Myxococcaceae bacterium]
MTVSFADAVSILVEEFTRKLIALLPSAAVAELDRFTFRGGAVASSKPSAAKSPAGTRSAGAKTRRATSGRPATARPGRRSSRQRKPSLDAIAALLREKPGIGSEEMQRTLGCSRSDLRVPMSRGLSMGVLRKTGEKRSTKYFAADGASAVEAPTRPSNQRRLVRAADAAGERTEPQG